MDNTVLVALISAGSSVLIAVTALLLNYRGFTALHGRFAALETRMQSFEFRFDARLTSLQADMKDLHKRMKAVQINVSRLKEMAGE
jgi:cell division protein FtsB